MFYGLFVVLLTLVARGLFITELFLYDIFRECRSTNQIHHLKSLSRTIQRCFQRYTFVESNTTGCLIKHILEAELYSISCAEYLRSMHICPKQIWIHNLFNDSSVRERRRLAIFSINPFPFHMHISLFIRSRSYNSKMDFSLFYALYCGTEISSGFTWGVTSDTG